MNNVILDLIPKSGSVPVDGAASGAGTKAGTAFEADVFRTALAGSLGSASTAAAPAQPTLVPADTTTLQALQTKISKMIEAGTSQADIITALAAQLASSVAQTVETPGADARAKLQTLFAAALAPPGRDDPANESTADRAATLAQRFIRLASLANAIAGQPSGQQKRIAGNVLDAQRAKDIPARTKTSDAAQAATSIVPASAATVAPLGVPPLPAASARPASASPAALAAAEVALPVTALSPAVGTASGDGRRVNIGSRTALSTGGDTGLGRILTRAVLADDARTSAVAARTGTATPGAKTGTLPAGAAASLFGPAQRAALVAGSQSAASAGSARAGLAAFVRSFEAALAAGDFADAARPAEHAALPGAGSVAPHSLGDGQPVSGLPVSAVAVDPVSPAPAAPAAPAVAVPIDHSAIADQVLRGAFLRSTGTSSEIRLSLVPETLGDVNVKLVVSSGSVAAHVVAETPEARDALVAAQPQLTKSLADAGLKLTSFNVDLAGSGFAGFSQQQNGQSQNENRARRSTASNESDDGIDEAGLTAIPSFGPSIVTKPAAGEFNYLV